MIYFLTTKRHNYTIRKCLASRGAPLAARVRPLCYGRLFLQQRYAPGTYIFSDLERLDATATRRAAEIERRMRSDDRFHVLNVPGETQLRFNLLNTLAERGLNDFCVYRLAEYPQPAHFPVFIRGEDDHKGPLSPLLYNQPELERWGQLFQQRCGGRDGKLVVEFCDVSDGDGVYRKYAAFKIGDRIIPRHLFFASHWCVKGWEHLEENYLDEEWRYLAEDPHQRQLRQIFDTARIDFGRIDYGVCKGRLQVWEINTNPMMPVDYGDGGPVRARVQDWFDARFFDATREIDDRSGHVPLSAKRVVPLWRAAEIPARAVYQRLRRGQRRRVA
ncbi:hypothetical protein FF011L_35020 [Roseimaritima multifibrata]|uniref:ATP-grasp domain-containing protein n=1 Tax=Roseimaritima multifibrata TaxID=1930274 RepID=A0A517MIJ9_9BACT|nr:hypothetical protein [Roseimaritima multifibrata]QDS94722.1 hypothetical protein FF011L_35020 [Roseimaritima multifibrata]